ncbi:Uncharacterized protein TCAP_06660 [Tolypocladium capitatum]|uniref:Major facilitator superfamily (MFS) profile domain-containing protein n=1 Tax=Tolypocladium capitatum TaxID=45235 RepID=A0A2K3Q7B1_9HYPO|nr:Uncharacterized protein TCAP_06660 [Tolypocladium capitatum]
MGDIPASSKASARHGQDKGEATGRACTTQVQEVETDPHVDLTLWQGVKKWPRIVFYCIAVASGILMYGYDYVIVGTTSAMPSFQRDFGELLNGKQIIPSFWLGIWTFASPGASVIGAYFGGFFQDWHGRRASFAVGAFVCAAGVAIAYVSNLPAGIDSRRSIFLAGKAVQGGAIGMLMTTTQTYMSEISPPGLRGPLLAFFPIFLTVGELIGAVVIFACLNLPNGYTTAFASQWPFSALIFVVAFIIPESPTYLVRKDKLELALKAQKRLEPKGTDGEETVGTIQRNIERERKWGNSTYVDCFKKANLRRTLLVMYSSILPQMFGITLLAKASYFVQIVGMAPSASVQFLIVGIVLSLLANVAAIWITARVGRRRLIYIGFAALSLLWLGMGIAGCWSGNAVVLYTAGSIIAIAIVSGISVWPASYAVGSEASALHLRAKAQGIGWLTCGVAASLVGFGLPYVFNPDQGNLGAKTGFVFAVVCAIGVVVTFFYVPEMKRRTASEIDCMFDLKLKAREFRNWPSKVREGEARSSV